LALLAELIGLRRPRRGEIVAAANSARDKENEVIRAIWNGKVVAESARTEIVESNHYFPADSVRKEYLRPSETHTVCAWKGTASYFSLDVDGKENRDAAWFYPEPKPAAQNIAGYVAFWKGVRVETTP
jgi:uncharacterized protein (DUF427 family)